MLREALPPTPRRLPTSVARAAVTFFPTCLAPCPIRRSPSFNCPTALFAISPHRESSVQPAPLGPTSASDRTIARLVASQWWGNPGPARNAGDVWITDGLARYSEALYAEQNAGKEAGLRAVDEFAVGALMYEDAAPVAQAARLAPYSPRLPLGGDEQRRDAVSHVARAHGRRGLQDHSARFYFATYCGKKRPHRRFREAIADKDVQAAAKPGLRIAPNLRRFFAQWLNSTGVPDFTLEFVVYRTPKGFRVVGKIKQPLDTFQHAGGSAH